MTTHPVDLTYELLLRQTEWWLDAEGAWHRVDELDLVHRRNLIAFLTWRERRYAEDQPYPLLLRLRENEWLSLTLTERERTCRFCLATCRHCHREVDECGWCHECHPGMPEWTID
jgi:hypothetical protein